jgi:hypothetical protein
MPANTEQIKRAIARAYRNGKCDVDGNSVMGAKGMTAKPRPMGRAKRYVYRDGKMVEVI